MIDMTDSKDVTNMLNDLGDSLHEFRRSYNEIETKILAHNVELIQLKSRLEDEEKCLKN